MLVKNLFNLYDMMSEYNSITVWFPCINVSGKILLA